LLATVIAGAVLVFGLRHLTRPLRELTEQLRAFRTDDDAVTPGMRGDEIGVLRSVTHAMQERIAHQFARLHEADRLRRELISNVSHDLRTPLSTIQGYLEIVLLRGDQLDALTRSQYLRTAMRHVIQLAQRVADLFELSKLDAGRVAPKCEVFRL